MSTLTPLRVRGKRRGTKAEKWNSGKQREISRNGSPASVRSSVVSSRATSATPRKRKRREIELSRLEELPAEIIQELFEWSANPNLALVSPTLSAQLSSHHVYHQITSQIFWPVLGHKGTTASDAELANATPILNSKFMTFEFFRRWIDQEIERNQLVNDDEEAEGVDMDLRKWNMLAPSPGLMPPAKLLRGPWSDDRVRFLKIFASKIENIAESDPSLGEAAAGGLRQAIAERSLDAIHTLIGLGLKANTELVQQAAIDEGCQPEIVLALIRTAVVEETSATADCPIDFFNPMLWSWADRAKANGNPKGKWLVDLLKDVTRITRETGKLERAPMAKLWTKYITPNE